MLHKENLLEKFSGSSMLLTTIQHHAQKCFVNYVHNNKLKAIELFLKQSIMSISHHFTKESVLLLSSRNLGN